jgi:hypothetical protein
MPPAVGPKSAGAAAEITCICEVVVGDADAVEQKHVTEGLAAEYQHARGAFHHGRRQQHQRVELERRSGERVKLVVVD